MWENLEKDGRTYLETQWGKFPEEFFLRNYINTGDVIVVTYSHIFNGEKSLHTEIGVFTDITSEYTSGRRYQIEIHTGKKITRLDFDKLESIRKLEPSDIAEFLNKIRPFFEGMLQSLFK